jgi:hypothetical protein
LRAELLYISSKLRDAPKHSTSTYKNRTPFFLKASEYSESAPDLFELFALVEMQFENLVSQSRLMNMIKIVCIAGIAKGD